MLAGFAIFSFLGHMAHVYKTPVSKVVKEGQTYNTNTLSSFGVKYCHSVSFVLSVLPV